MLKRIVIVMVICFMGVAALADNWKEGVNGLEYNCEILSNVMQAFQASDSDQIKALSTQTLVRTSSAEISAAQYFGIDDTTAPEMSNRQQALLEIVNSACDPAADLIYATTLFNVQIDSDANIRSCASTTCTIVRPAEAGEMLSVIGVKGDWYQIKGENGIAYIASFLVHKVMCL